MAEPRLSVVEAAGTLGVTPGRVRQLIALGRLPAGWRRGRRAVRRADLAGLTDQRRRLPVTATGPADELLSGSQAARLLGVTRQRVSQLVRQGRLPATRRGRSLLLRRADLAPLLPTLRTPAAAGLPPTVAGHRNRPTTAGTA